MSRPRFRFLSIILVGLVPLTACADPIEVEVAKISVKAAPNADEIMLGEPGFVSFKVCNQSNRAMRIQVGGDYRNRLGRPESFRVEVVGPDGKPIAQPDAGSSMGGLTWAENLPAQGEYAFHLFLPHWAKFEKPGRYTMTIRRKLVVIPEDGGKAVPDKAAKVDVVATTTLNIVPPDVAKFGKLIDRLAEQMLDRKSDQAERAERMMSVIDDERVIPHFVELAEKPHSSPRLAACAALAKFKNDEAFEALKKLTKTTGADIRESATTLALAESSAAGVRGSAVHAIGKSPHPKAIAFFWTFADDPNYAVRITVLHKAAELKTPEARAIIEKLTSDGNDTVRNEAIRYQKKLAAEFKR